MRTFKVARMATRGSNEKDIDCIPREEDTKNELDTGVNEQSAESESELEEGMGKSQRKRVQSFHTNNQNASRSDRKRKVTFSSDSTGKSVTIGDEQSSSSNAEIAELRNKIDASLDLLQVRYDEKLAEILEENKAEWDAEKKCLEKKILDGSVEIEKLKQELSESNLLLSKSLAYINGVSDATEKMCTDGKKAAMCIQNFLPTK